MAFRGLFIGINQYLSPRTSWLSFARRDAEALRALFGDTFSTQPDLLVDDQATKAGIEGALTSLAGCDKDDFVAIFFSGHGTRQHHLLTYDADPDRLDETAIPLAKLMELFSKIPAKHLVLILDCCFSGGVGAKVLVSEVATKDTESVDQVLQQLSGEGRLIITASAANEMAMESTKLEHGFLTFYLLEALQGVEEVVQAGKIELYRMLGHVTKRVSSAAAARGKTQTPTVKGNLTGLVEWPIFKPGAMYAAGFPDEVPAKVSADLNSLSALRFPPQIIQSWAGSIKQLNQLQVDAINDFALLAGENVVVSAPTSSGKTMVGELAAVYNSIRRRRALFLFPLKALVNDKHRHFRKTYGAYGIRTIRATGDSTDDIPALMRGQYDVCLMTYEKFSALALRAPHIIDQVGSVIVDEVQMIADPNRGVNLEFILTLLRVRQREGSAPQVIALSAVIGNTNGFEQWLGGRLLKRVERPVPLDEGVLNSDGTWRYRSTDSNSESVDQNYITPEFSGKNSSQDLVIPLVKRLVAEGKQVIVFRETKGEARGCAKYLAKALELPAATEAVASLPNGDPSGASAELRHCLAQGVAFHIADLDREERLTVEEQFRIPNSKIRVIAATTTLAMGVNTPAEAVVVVGLMHPQDQPYSVAEYKNIVGRAGRLGFATRGASYLIALTGLEEDNYWRDYVAGTPEDLNSMFLDGDQDTRSLIIRTLAAAKRFAGAGLTTAQVLDFLRASFGAFLKERKTGSQPISQAEIEAALQNLLQHGLVEGGGQAPYQLTDLGRLAGEAGVEVESITRLVDVLKPLAHDELTDPTLVTATQVTVEVDGVYMPSNKKSTQKEPETWFGYLKQQRIPSHVLQALRLGVETPKSTVRAKKASACLLWMSDTPLLEIEEYLTQHGGSFDGIAGPLRSTASRTVDLLGVTIEVAKLLHPKVALDGRAERLLARLEVGVSASMGPVAQCVGGRLSRPNYLSLVKNKLVTLEMIRAADEKLLLTCLEGDALKLQDLLAVIDQQFKALKPKTELKPMPNYEQ